jgi:porin
VRISACFAYGQIASTFFGAMLVGRTGIGRVIHLSDFPSICVIRFQEARRHLASWCSAINAVAVGMKLRRWPIHCAVVAVLAGMDAAPLRAQGAPESLGITEPSIATSLPQNGDPFGIRKQLYDHGISYNLIYTNDVLSNLSGGIKRGTIDEGKLETQLYIDLGKFAGWKDWTFYANAFGIYNTGRIRRDYVGGMNTIAAIEASPTVRLSELWLERQFGPTSVRFGQLAADAEFFYSDLSQIFLQSDWPTIGEVNLPGGGPAYPLSALGARIKYEFPKDASLLFAIFNGNTSGPCSGEPDTCNRYGFNFRLSDPAFMLGEFQFRRNRGKDDTGLATTLKIGGWSHLGQFADQQYANNGMLLASPASSGVPLMHRGDYGIYGVIDQQLYRPNGGSPDSGISIFNRTAISPSDRNLVNFEIDSGIVFAGMIPKRPDDVFGASVIYSRFSNSIRAFDQEQINFGNPTTPPRDYEANLELTYVAQIVPGWIVQPVYTAIWHPSGTGIRYPDAQVTGVRTVIRF